LLFQSKVT